MKRPQCGACFSASFALLLGLSLPALAEEKLRIVTEELPPFNMTIDGHLTGLCTEIVEAVLDDIGETATIQSMPWARAYDIATNTENVLIYCMARTASRELKFKWVDTIAQTDWYLFSLNPNLRLNSLDEARRLQIATVKDDAGEQYLIAKGFVVGQNLQSSNKYEHNYEKLLLGRVDLWIANEPNAMYLARSAGQDPAQTLHRALPLANLGSVQGLSMAFSLKTPDATVERFRTGLKHIRDSGRYDAITRKWQ
jgi:polar amino acid transport system substrate-binding protein